MLRCSRRLGETARGCPAWAMRRTHFSLAPDSIADRGWQPVAAGIIAWFVLPDAGWWVAAIAGALMLALGAVALWRGVERRAHLLVACVGVRIVVGGAWRLSGGARRWSARSRSNALAR